MTLTARLQGQVAVNSKPSRTQRHSERDRGKTQKLVPAAVVCVDPLYISDAAEYSGPGDVLMGFCHLLRWQKQVFAFCLGELYTNFLGRMPATYNG